ncbi:MAG: hypothetical protein CM1200mP1_15150 [Candidatus Neomarinimicrobiota bacterium]|nr:MAG: hypothetical protein CM1200mP1_15150 [Candidatus Neomarinimicrobiota bacterium]
MVGFFGTYYMATGAATIFMQFFITGIVLARFGKLAGLLFLPISLAFGTSGFLMIPILASVFMAKFSAQRYLNFRSISRTRNSLATRPQGPKETSKTSH